MTQAGSGVSWPFNLAMNDDFNTPVALSILFQLSHQLNKTNSAQLVHLKISCWCFRFTAVTAGGFKQDCKMGKKNRIEQLIQERFFLAEAEIGQELMKSEIN